MRKPILFLTILLIFNGELMAQEFEVGQIWEYKTRSQEIGSTFTIVKIDEHSVLGKIFHISIENVKVTNPHIKNGYSSMLPHSPVSEDAVRKSITKLVRVTKNLPPFEEGYKTWKKAFDSGEGGNFTISVSEIVEVIEKAINQ